MKFVMMTLLTLSALAFSGCGHYGHRGGGCCGKMEAQKECSGDECSMSKNCSGCQKAGEKPAN